MVREDVLIMFCEHFDARRYLLRLFGVLNGSEDVESCKLKARGDSSREEMQDAKVKAAEVFNDMKYKFWCKLVHCRDKKCRLACNVLCDRFECFERHQLQQLIQKLTSLRKDKNETIIGYIARSEDLLYNLG